MSAFIEKLNIWYGNLPMRQRYLVLAGISSLLIAGMSFLVSPAEQPVSRVSPSEVKSKPADSQPVMPKGYVAQTMRDPFAPPEGFGKADKPVAIPQAGYRPAPAGPAQERVVVQDFSQETLPLLVGVVTGGNRQMAIINYNNTSRSYYLGEQIGVYKLAKIDTNSVVVQGPGGRRVLTLGR